jgi:DNA-binding transcriptional ArsR family regulator
VADKEVLPEPLCQANDPQHRLQPSPLFNVKAFDRASRLFRALADVPRLRLLSRLADGEVCVTALAAAEGESMAVISQRLRVLRGEELVTRRRSGKHVFYALADKHVLDLFSNAVAHAGKHSPGRRAVSTEFDPDLT